MGENPHGLRWSNTWTLLVTVDSHSRFVDAEWFPTTTATATCKYLHYLFFRSPKVIVSDNDTQFTAENFAQLCAKFNIIHLCNPPGHSQSNSLAEHMVNTLKCLLNIQVLSQKEASLNQFWDIYNYTPCKAAPDHKSPAEIFFRKYRIPLDTFNPMNKPRVFLSCQQKKMKKQFNAHHVQGLAVLFPGQQVMVKLSNDRRVFKKIVSCIGSAIARIRVDSGIIKRHFNQIWKWTDSLR